MNLLDIVNRTPSPRPWEEGDKIPWNDPNFSRRMLAFHTGQANDAASRRADIIDRHVGWIHNAVLSGRPSRVLDLGCGDGSLLASLQPSRGVGVDVSLPTLLDARRRHPDRWGGGKTRKIELACAVRKAFRAEVHGFAQLP